MADALFGGERLLISINMSEFQEKHTISRLIGSPPGYVGYGEGGRLTEAVRRQPYSAVLFDEVEKAHPDVLHLFYQMFDKGVLADGEGREVDFRNTLIFLTSNLGTILWPPSARKRKSPTSRPVRGPAPGADPGVPPGPAGPHDRGALCRHQQGHATGAHGHET